MTTPKPPPGHTIISMALMERRVPDDVRIELPGVDGGWATAEWGGLKFCALVPAAAEVGK